MHEYQREFIRFALDREVLRFGEFTLKSGRKSPYFFNAGLFNSGGSLSRLGRFYAQALVHSELKDVDVIFGPAYKGIPLAAVTAVALADSFDRDFGIPVISIVSLNQVMSFIADDAELQRHLPAVEAYRAEYGI